MAETFNFEPQNIWETTTEHNVLVSTFESGKEQRRYKGAKPKQWRLSFAGSWDTISAIIDFYDARKGPYEAFNWTPFGDSTAKSVRFKENSLSVNRVGKAIWAECEVSLVEVL